MGPVSAEFRRPHTPAPVTALSQCPPERQWAIITTGGHVVTGYLPTWATTDPSERDVPLDELADRLADINHWAAFPGQTITVHTPETGRPIEEEILHGSIDCNPYADAPEPRIPVANIHVAAECWISDLDPDDLARLAAQLRAQADRLEHQVRPALIAARTDWMSRPH
jgi:hypothetical protein